MATQYFRSKKPGVYYDCNFEELESGEGEYHAASGKGPGRLRRSAMFTSGEIRECETQLEPSPKALSPEELEELALAKAEAEAEILEVAEAIKENEAKAKAEKKAEAKAKKAKPKEY